MENLLKKFPLHINPMHAIAYLLVLLFIPHLAKRRLMVQKLREDGKQFTTSNSRGLSALLIDDSSLGMQIANYLGCHNNGWEAFSYFTAATLCCMVVKVDKEVISGAAGLFVVLRILYTFVYMSKYNGSPRTYLFFMCAGLTLGMFVLAGNKYNA